MLVNAFVSPFFALQGSMKFAITLQEDSILPFFRAANPFVQPPATLSATRSFACAC
jgi:hypothetical protein